MREAQTDLVEEGGRGRRTRTGLSVAGRPGCSRVGGVVRFPTVDGNARAHGSAGWCEIPTVDGNARAHGPGLVRKPTVVGERTPQAGGQRADRGRETHTPAASGAEGRPWSENAHPSSPGGSRRPTVVGNARHSSPAGPNADRGRRTRGPGAGVGPRADRGRKRTPSSPGGAESRPRSENAHPSSRRQPKPTMVGTARAQRRRSRSRPRSENAHPRQPAPRSGSGRLPPRRV